MLKSKIHISRELHNLVVITILLQISFGDQDQTVHTIWVSYRIIFCNRKIRYHLNVSGSPSGSWTVDVRDRGDHRPHLHIYLCIRFPLSNIEPAASSAKPTGSKSVNKTPVSKQYVPSKFRTKAISLWQHNVLCEPINYRQSL